jgi:hypothetical protein
MMLLKADKTTEAGVLPTREDLEIMSARLAVSGFSLGGKILQARLVSSRS